MKGNQLCQKVTESNLLEIKQKPIAEGKKRKVLITPAAL